ncbi:acyltransferase [Dysgonomonas sp. 511]|uniref:acyltransferase n=1 Tax=Dysgonomonas sp. 511 TaxID=2302930 RepID=UPI0013D8DD63|nr:acyltransferase [Dysgonomonas sp. 511]
MKKGSAVRVYGNNSSVEIGKNCVIEQSSLSIFGDNSKIILGDNIVIRKGQFQVVGNNARIQISKETTIRECKIIAQEDSSSVYIGDDCMLSSNILIRTSDAHSVINEANKRINLPKNVIIGSHVWISQSVTILKGCTIGDNSIVGYGSICTKDIPANCIAVGNPAIIVKKNITWNRKIL